jgi:hypothetical protein
MDPSRSMAPSAVPPLSSSLARALEIAQQLAADELRLLQIESREQLHAGLRRSAWLAAGALCGAIAWVALLSAVVVALDGRFSLEARLGGLALSQALIAVVLVACGLRRGGAGR